MRGTIFFLIIFFLLTAIAFAGGGGKVEWVTDYEKGMKDAKKFGKATMLYFTSPT